jgi:hypothetical protein
MEILLQRAAREKGLDSLMTEVRRGHVDALERNRILERIEPKKGTIRFLLLVRSDLLRT